MLATIENRLSQEELCSSARTVSVKIFDSQGNLSYEESALQLTPRMNEISIPLANLGLRRGAYTVLLSSDRFETSARILIE